MSYLLSHLASVSQLAAEHLALSLSATAVAGLPGIVGGIVLTRPMFRSFAPAVLSVGGALQSIPAIAIVALSFLVLGIGPLSALVALIAYSITPILFNTTAGLLAIPAAPVEAARAIGLAPRQTLLAVELPLARSAVLAGVRSAVTMNIGTATIASFVGGGGLGDLIFTGLKLFRLDMILTGAVLAALLALGLDGLLALVEGRMARTESA